MTKKDRHTDRSKAQRKGEIYNQKTCMLRQAHHDNFFYLFIQLFYFGIPDPIYYNSSNYNDNNIQCLLWNE